MKMKQLAMIRGIIVPNTRKKQKEVKTHVLYLQNKRHPFTQIEVELTENIVKNVKFIGGCQEIFQALRLVEGTTVEEVERRISGIHCKYEKHLLRVISLPCIARSL